MFSWCTRITKTINLIVFTRALVRGVVSVVGFEGYVAEEKLIYSGSSGFGCGPTGGTGVTGVRVNPRDLIRSQTPCFTRPLAFHRLSHNLQVIE